VPEWLNGIVSKTIVGSGPPRVRIPPSPLKPPNSAVFSHEETASSGSAPSSQRHDEWEEVWTGDFIFENEWQSFRTKKDRLLEPVTPPHEVPAGRRKIAVKVVDIFGNDTMMKIFDVVWENDVIIFCHFEGAIATEKSSPRRTRFLAVARNDKAYGIVISTSARRGEIL
jgi:hypothetical protein